MDIQYSCDKCGTKIYLYKELLPDGKAIIVCNKIGCDWKSAPVERHEGVRILKEIKKDWA